MSINLIEITYRDSDEEQVSLLTLSPPMSVSPSPENTPCPIPEISPPTPTSTSPSPGTSPPISPQKPPGKHPRLASEVDIGVFVSQKSSGSTVTDDDKYSLIVNNYTPSATAVFPSNNDGRRFQFAWIARFQWLRYSKHGNGGYCLPCVLFARSVGADLGVLVTKPLINFRKALEIL